MKKVTFAAVLVLSLVLLASCATTRLESTWVNDEFRGPLKFDKVIAIIISPDPDLRRELEGKLSVIVRKTEVVPAYLALSDETLQDPAKARTALVESGFDGAIVMRLLLADQQVHFSRPYYNDFWNYYGYAWPVVMGPTYSYTDTRIKLETLIYDLEKGDRIWAGISQTMNPSDVGDLLVQTAEAVRVDLQKEGLIE